jgi:threonine/homoserine/homoserine lactone efflux protein
VDPQALSFIAFTVVLVVTPGAATAVVVRNVLHRGTRGGIAAASGAATGNATWAVVAALGLATAFATMPLATAVLQYGGAAYLAYLGARGIIGAWRVRPTIIPGALEPRGDRHVAETHRDGWLQGLTTALLNPPVATFYLTVVPSFLPAPGTLQRRFFVYAAIHVGLAFACHSTWAFALQALRGIWARPAARRTLETLTGVALLALAWRVAAA